MIKKLSFSLLIIFSFLLLNLYGAEDTTLFPREIKAVKDRGYLNVAQFNGQRAGFYAYDTENKSPATIDYNYDGKRLVGVDIDLSYLIAKQLGVELKINREFQSFDDVAKAVAAGKADIAVSKLSLTTNRAQFVHYTRPYIKLRMGVLINRLEESKMSFLNKDKNNRFGSCYIKGVKIGVLGKSSFVDHGKKLFPDAKIIEFDGRDALFKAITEGQVLAVLYEEYEISRVAKLDPDIAINCRTEYFEDKNDYIAIAVNPKDTTLLTFINILLDKENINPTINDLLNKYVPEEQRTEKEDTEPDKLNTSSVYITSILSIFFILLWINMARQIVSKKESGEKK